MSSMSTNNINHQIPFGKPLNNILFFNFDNLLSSRLRIQLHTQVDIILAIKIKASILELRNQLAVQLSNQLSNELY